MSKALSLIRNSFLFPNMPTPTKNNQFDRNTNLFNKNAGGSNDPKKNLGNIQLPVPPSRKVETIEDWRNGVSETERSILPYRVQIQEIFRDTYLNPHVNACFQRRKELTLLRTFALCDANDKPLNEWNGLLQKSWFRNFISYALDAQFYGYSLISLGDCIPAKDGYGFPLLTEIRRDLISPERREVTSIPYNPAGFKWDDEEYAPWHIWVDTPTEHGTNACGLGLFYTVALREINLRNLYGFYMDFLEVFGSPYRALFMENVLNEEERGMGIAALNNQGGGNYGIFGKDDKVEFIGPSGPGFKAYDSATASWCKDISKVILGHGDALDSVPGKLGASQGGGKNGGDHSPVKDALVAKQAVDALFLTPIINEELLPRLRYHGIDIPEDVHFKFLNSEEDQILQDKQMDMNIKLSEIAKNLIGSGYEIDKEYFEAASGIKLQKSSAQPEQI